MTRASLIGALMLVLPALAAAWLMLWQRYRQVFWLATALILVGVGYLVATGAADDIGYRLAPTFTGPPPVAPAR
jgi:hypothetical protein